MAPKPERQDFERLSEREMLSLIWGCMQQMNDQNASVLTTQKQIIMALIAIVAASIGLKFVGSPPWVILAVYTSWLAGIFAILSVICFWRKLDWPQRLLRLGFSAFLFFSVVSRTFLFKSQAPEWFQIGIDTGFVFLSLFLIWSAWAMDAKEKNGSVDNKAGC